MAVYSAKPTKGAPMSSKDHRTEYNDWYSSKMWRKRSRAQRQSNPLCEDCLECGLVTPAEVADHVEPHKGDWNSFRLGALRSLCKLCHDSGKKRTEHRGYSTEIGIDGWPTDPRHPAYSGHNKQLSGMRAKVPATKMQPTRESSFGTLGPKSWGRGGV